jgi:hypothetical protein
VKKGSLFALLGPNGAGKSTTIKILTTLLAPSKGRAMVAGFDVATDPREVRRRSGVVFQDSSLDDRLTARENLMLHVAIFGVPSASRAKQVNEKLEWIGLSSVADQSVRTFSGGMRRRLARVARLAGRGSGLTGTRAASFGTTWPLSRRAASAPSSSRRTTWTRPNAATTLPSSITGGSSPGGLRAALSRRSSATNGWS